jgi:hypothetical protein
MGELDSKSPHYQTALAMAALAAAIAATMQELWPDEEPLSVLLTKAQVQLTNLRQNPNAEGAVAIFRLIRDSLRNADEVRQPEG